MSIEVDFSDVAVKAPALPLSPQQQAVMDWIERGSGNATILAVAGSGKTTTLIEGLSRMQGSIAFLAYNKRIAEEIEVKVAVRAPTANVRVSTFHAAGYRALRRASGRLVVDAKKVEKIAESLTTGTYVEYVTKLVSIAKQDGIGCDGESIQNTEHWRALSDHHGLDDILTGRKPWEPETTFSEEEIDAMVERGIRLSISALQDSLDDEATIDFDDQIFLPIFRQIEMEQFDWVLIDEAQDSNVMRRALAKAMLKDTGRLIAVGDERQAIYGFTGVSADAIERIEEDFHTTSLPLTVSFRCPRSVVAHAHQWVQHIEAADEAIEGEVSIIDYEELISSALVGDIQPDSAILCRKNAPLISIAFAMLRAHVPCHVEGRDIGGSIKTLAKKWKVTKLTELVRRVDAYKEREIDRLSARKQYARAEAIQDKCDTLLAIAEGLLDQHGDRCTVQDLCTFVDQIFTDSAGRQVGVTLSSIHKSKGREWPTVYWLGRNAYQPSPFARQAWQHVQEVNLQYVACTRAQNRLVEVYVQPKLR